MRLFMPAALSEYVQQETIENISRCKNGDTLIATLDATKAAIPFFKAAWSDKDWMARADQFLLGRLHELVQTHHVMDLAVRTKNAAAPVLTDQDRFLKQMLAQTTTETDARIFEERTKVTDSELFKEFTDTPKFIQLINENRFVAGRIFERIRHLHCIHGRSGPSLELRMQEVFIKSALYHLKSKFTPDDNGFYALLEYRLPDNFDALLTDLSSLDIPWDAKLICLQDKKDENGNFSIDLIFEDLDAWKLSNGGRFLFGTKPLRREFSVFLKSIDDELLRPVPESLPEPFAPSEASSSSSSFPASSFSAHDSYPLYKEPGCFFNDLVDHCQQLHETNKRPKLLRLLSHMPMPRNFKQFIIFENFSNEELRVTASEDFEVFRSSLSQRDLVELYDVFSHSAATSSKSSSRLSSSPPDRKRSSDSE